ncbi:hypothetical protein IL252_16100 [Halomicrobium sp. IBSBa]|uniref:hypothetical protein n=1 Tax=Halomicrobium TaxID=203135 RepID=UPI001473A1F5|nr:MULTISPECIES: hypothetical protein [Halomicrobium]MBO4249336.1 hypothetical protein [Halomicrobium sp. IBSBa]
MPQLEVHLSVDAESEPTVYHVDGDLKRPGEAIQAAKELATEDGHEGVELEEVKLAETA